MLFGSTWLFKLKSSHVWGLRVCTVTTGLQPSSSSQTRRSEVGAQTDVRGQTRPAAAGTSLKSTRPPRKPADQFKNLHLLNSMWQRGKQSRIQTPRSDWPERYEGYNSPTAGPVFHLTHCIQACFSLCASSKHTHKHTPTTGWHTSSHTHKHTPVPCMIW